MPIHFIVKEAHGICISHWHGVVSDGELIPSYQRLFAMVGWEPGFHELADLRGADFSALTTGGLRQLTAMVDGYMQGKCAGFRTAVVARRDLPFGMARLYGALSEQSPEIVMVFREIEPALAWLGVDESVIA